MQEQTNNKSIVKNDVLFVIILITFILFIVAFNFIVDPYYIFRNSTIKGFNNVKIHRYTNRRTILYADVKLNSKNKDTAFTGNCILFHNSDDFKNTVFYTLPIVKINEISDIIKNVHKIAPNIKKIYLGIYFDDFWNFNKVFDPLISPNSKFLTYKDLINILFSFNTTKYSIETVTNSIKNNENDTLYIYPFREIANKTYDKDFNFNELTGIKEVKEFAEKNNIELVIYYSPIHITKKIHIYEKGMWESNQELKRELAKIAPFYDYSFSNIYNTNPLDENNDYFIDNIHPSAIYNHIIISDLLSNKKEIGTLINNDNIENYLKEDTKQLEEYILSNPILSNKIKNIKPEDANIRIMKNNAK